METNGDKKEPVKKSRFLNRLIEQPEIGVLIPLVLLFIVTAFGNENFLTSTNLTAVLRLLVCYAFCAMGISFVLLCGDIDISVGMTAGLGAMILAALTISRGWNIWLSVSVSLVFAVVAGLVKGFFVAKVGMFPYIVTIGFMFVFKGLKYVTTNGYPVFPFPPEVVAFARQRPLGLNWPFFLVLALFIIFEIVLRKTTFGRKVYAVGDNKEVARLAGINVMKIRIIAYVICSIMCVIAGITTTLAIGVGDPSLGEGWEMYAIASSAIGGIAMKGGKGSLIGTAIGVLFIALLNNSMVMFALNSNLQTALTGALLILAVLMDMFKSSRKMKL